VPNSGSADEILNLKAIKKCKNKHKTGEVYASTRERVKINSQALKNRARSKKKPNIFRRDTCGKLLS
jgi:hypothetical protein